MSSAAGQAAAETCDRALLSRIHALVHRARPSAFPERTVRRKRRNGQQWRLSAQLYQPFFWSRSQSPSSICLFHGPHRLHKGPNFSGIFFARLALHAAGNGHAPGMKYVDRLLHIAGTQSAGNDQLADAVDDSGPGLDAFPVKLLPRTATAFLICGIE